MSERGRPPNFSSYHYITKQDLRCIAWVRTRIRQNYCCDSLCFTCFRKYYSACLELIFSDFYYSTKIINKTVNNFFFETSAAQFWKVGNMSKVMVTIKSNMHPIKIIILQLEKIKWMWGCYQAVQIRAILVIKSHWAWTSFFNIYNPFIDRQIMNI